MIPKQFLDLRNSIGKLVINHNMGANSQIPPQTPLQFGFLKLPQLYQNRFRKKYFDKDNV